MRAFVFFLFLVVVANVARLVPMENAPRCGGSEAVTPDTFTRVHVEMAPLSEAQRVALADEIVQGRVISVREESPSGKLARTVVRLQVVEALKGAPEPEITVAVGGARNGPRLVLVDGAPDFQVGEEVLLLLARAPGVPERGIVGLASGTYRAAVGAEPLATVKDRVRAAVRSEGK